MNARAWLVFAGLGIIWGLPYLFIKIAVRELSPFDVAWGRITLAALLLAPLAPFIADEIYENLDGSEPSVHLCDWPEPGARDEQLEWQMQVVRDAVELGRAARAHAKSCGEPRDKRK